jgi:hypothetical protein
LDGFWLQDLLLFLAVDGARGEYGSGEIPSGLQTEARRSGKISNRADDRSETSLSPSKFVGNVAGRTPPGHAFGTPFPRQTGAFDGNSISFDLKSEEGIASLLFVHRGFQGRW